MKKQHFPLLIAVTFLFTGFLLGFLTGRNIGASNVTISVPAQMLTMPAQTEPAQSEDEEIVFPIDLNKARKEELLALPGIGEKLTGRILAYRRERGRFFSVEDLLNIEGITENILKKIENLVMVGG